jgi:uncharacterized protein
LQKILTTEPTNVNMTMTIGDRFVHRSKRRRRRIHWFNLIWWSYFIIVIVIDFHDGHLIKVVDGTAIQSSPSLTSSSCSRQGSDIDLSKHEHDGRWRKMSESYSNSLSHVFSRRFCAVSWSKRRGGGSNELEDTSRSGSRKRFSRMWPPWPISLLNPREDSVPTSADGTEEESIEYDSGISMGALAWAYLRQRVRIGIRQGQEASSQVWFHLPPASPPLLLYACLPRSKIITVIQDGTSVEVSRRVFPAVSNPFARTLVLASLGLAVLSWSNQELARKRKLTPIPFPSIGDSVSKVLLPPVLPVEIPELEIEALQSATRDSNNEITASDNNNDDEDNSILSRVSPRIKKHLQEFYETASQPKRNVRYYFHEWKRRRSVRKREVAKIKRMSTFDELVALQALKRKAAAAVKKKNKSISKSMPDNSSETSSWALVTGASSGIGRAIAVELARWDIPIILVARDVSKLWRLAEDLQICYGIKCCVLGADLSEIDAAEKIYQTTTDAGMKIEILCNNAGIASEGLSVDIPTEDIDRMVTVNCLNYAKLAQLYGRDMKERRRGRILMVSSMAGLASANPNVAVYGATKAFGKSMALAMAKELEAYGVGVTCLLPGAVNTNFRESTPNALLWKLPFYARPADIVAHQGVMSLFDGDSQVIPGFQNRLFANIVRPIIPQRFEVMVVQAAFGAIHFPSIIRRKKDSSEHTHIGTNTTENPADLPPSTPSSKHKSSLMPLHLEPRYHVHPPPQVLRLPEPVKEEELNSTALSEIESVEPDDFHITASSNNVTAEDSSTSLKVNEDASGCPIKPPKEDHATSLTQAQATEHSVQSDIVDPSPREQSVPDRDEGKEGGHIPASDKQRGDNETDSASKSNLDTTHDVSETTKMGGRGGHCNSHHQPPASLKGSKSTYLDYDVDDRILSPSLGPVDIMDHHTFY